MPIGLNSLELAQWYKLPEKLFGKSIQHSFRFYVTMFDNPFGGRERPNGPMPIIRSYHVTDITIPSYQAEKVTQLYGQIPRSFPVLKMGEELAVTIGFEEDENGTIAYFINWLQRLIMNQDGLYRSPMDMKFSFIIVEIQDNQGLPVVYYTFHDPYFLQTSEPQYSYASDESIKYNITFGVDRISTHFTKYGLINVALKKVINGLI
jgi:hypothetical protein